MWKLDVCTNVHIEIIFYDFTRLPNTPYDNFDSYPPNNTNPTKTALALLPD
jgi:hypothetical protein